MCSCLRSTTICAAWYLRDVVPDDIESVDVTRARIALGALAYAALVAHLLFIPYLYSPLPLDETMRRFAQLPWMQLGSDQNVALVSRGLMFAPLGLLLAAWVAPEPRRIEVAALLVAVILGGLWATVVNVAQLWFPMRTVSLNNLAAEFVGVIVGGGVWATLGATGQGWWRRLASGGGVSAEAALTGYVILYAAASLTPFDFVTSAGELAEKAASNLYSLWIAPISCGPAPCGLKFAAAILAAIPCGWWFASRRRGDANAWLSAVPVALVFATIIELLHFLMVSGVSQGASMIARASGIVLGAATYSSRHRLATADLGRLGRPVVLALLVPYLVAVAYVGGWIRAPKVGIRVGLARLADVVWMPFYNQYYSPYQSTMYSTMVHAALYAPVGVACWLWARHRDSVPLWRRRCWPRCSPLSQRRAKCFWWGACPIIRTSSSRPFPRRWCSQSCGLLLGDNIQRETPRRIRMSIRRSCPAARKGPKDPPRRQQPRTQACAWSAYRCSPWP